MKKFLALILLSLGAAGFSVPVAAHANGTSYLIIESSADGPVSLRWDVGLVDLVWTDVPVAGEVLAQTSAHAAARPARLDPDGRLSWREPQRRVAPGQSVVLYDLTDTVVLGGGLAA